MDKIYEEVAHDAEILSLSFSREIDGECVVTGARVSGLIMCVIVS